MAIRINTGLRVGKTQSLLRDLLFGGAGKTPVKNMLNGRVEYVEESKPGSRAHVLEGLILGEQVLEQRSPEWFAWRLEGIGSSEAATLMGFNLQYKTLEQLWYEKVHRVIPEQRSSFLSDRGTRLEPKARREYETFKNILVEDKTLVHPKFSFIRASLDGWNAEHSLILEIKCPSQKNHYRAVAENYVKPEYYTQIQHQYLASGAMQADYWSFDGKSGHCIPVLPDAYFMGELLEREILFWNCVVNKVKPDPNDFRPL